MDENSFAAFIQQVRVGDEQAATELVRLCEPEIRREVRLRLRDPGMKPNNQDVGLHFAPANRFIGSRSEHDAIANR